MTLLVTSRAPLDISEERIYPVAALELPDPSRPLEVGRLRRTEAVRLFVDRARDARADFELSEPNADAVAELCVRLDGLPLALELAAARIKLLSPGDILVRLGRRLEFLKAEPGAGVPERHRTLRAAIEWSYDLLTEEEQSLFTSLAVFVGGFTLDGAEAVAGDLELDVLDGVESLLNNNLLRTERMAGGEPRFGMLETIREYALERLAERGDGEAVRRRHADFYVLLAEKADPALFGPQQLSWLERLDAELANIRGALTWSAESGEAEVGLRIGTRALALLAAARVQQGGPRAPGAAAVRSRWVERGAGQGAVGGRKPRQPAGRPRNGVSAHRGEPARPSGAGRRRGSRNLTRPPGLVGSGAG